MVVRGWHPPIDRPIHRPALVGPGLSPYSCRWDEFELVVTVKERGKAGDEGVDGVVRGLRKMKEPIARKIQQFEKELQEQ